MNSPARASIAVKRAIFGGNLYNATELAGAFGDLGTLIPFVIGYIVVAKIDPVGILVSLGILKIFVGIYFKTPVPIQPMKAIGASAIANPAAITPGMVWGSGLFSAVIWIIMAVTGAITWLEKITARPVMRGIMLGLGISFMLEGLKMMSAQWLLAVVAFVLACLLLSSKRLPAILVLLCLGIISSLVLNPGLFEQLRQTPAQFRLPELVFGKVSWREILLGSLMLGIPQLPLTLGNAVLGTVAENNQLFPERPTTVKKVALDHGLINAVSFTLGGIPVCHGAGGMAGHVRFGARTGGALVMLGVIMLLLGLFFSRSVATLFNMIPAAVLGVILFFAGLELASISWDVSTKKQDTYVMLLTAGIAVINIGIAFAAGLALFYALRSKVVKL
ncbi:MAG: putative sulfate/molybdate transporter [Dehalococcoidales bacterium]|nr:putative sulfate/molybdate transporter [Dehalococcoidales bacterium]